MFDVKSLVSEVSAVRQFGSVVRGDSDHLSDRDILVLVRRPPLSEQLQEIICRWREENHDVSVYTEERYKQMHRNGHLFTWHIFLESDPLDLMLKPTESKDFIDQSDAPAMYGDARSDSLALLELLDESVDS